MPQSRHDRFCTTYCTYLLVRTQDADQPQVSRSRSSARDGGENLQSECGHARQLFPLPLPLLLPPLASCLLTSPPRPPTPPPPSSLAALAGAALAAAAPPSQINIHYTPTPGTLSVDFVSAAADGVVQFGTSANPASFNNGSTTSFNFDEVGMLHQGLLPFAASPAGASGFYRVCSGGECSAVFHVVPNVAAGQERFAVFGDFGIINDESMTDLIASAAKGAYDSVLHVGDWAYDLDGIASTIGNLFMETGQGYVGPSIRP